jgi:hypothetical protein
MLSREHRTHPVENDQTTPSLHIELGVLETHTEVLSEATENRFCDVLLEILKLDALTSTNHLRESSVSLTFFLPNFRFAPMIN